MKKIIRILVPILLGALVVSSIGWYLFVYDRDFTRDILLREARLNDMRGNTGLSAWFYRMAYSHSGNDEAVAIELANQYKMDGNYTKAEVTLTNAIKANPSIALYAALSRTFAEQDKLMDADALLNSIADPVLRQQMDALRPSTPSAIQLPGFYSQYTNVELYSSSGTLLYTTNGEFPSIKDKPYSSPIPLPAGETIIRCISVDQNGLVSSLGVLGYTVGGVVEPAIFMDASMEFAIRDQLDMNYEEMLYTSDMWDIEEFTVPTQIWTLEDLSKLTHLKKLKINNLQLSSLSDLTALTELEELDLTNCRFPANELSVLKKLPQLSKLILADCGISTIAELEGLTSLTYLDISGNTIRNLEPISDMTNMRELYMQHNAVVSLESLTGMIWLEKLNVSYNALTALAPLSTCARLTWLDASNNQLTSVNGITALPLLTSLSLNFNQLGDVSPLGACIQLKELSINNNHLYDISTLASLTRLEVFDFSYNSIASLPTWTEIGELRRIQGSYNEITSLFYLSNMPNLTYVSMEYNHLSDINILANCYNLVRVDVFGNSITDVSALTEHNIIVNYNPQ